MLADWMVLGLWPLVFEREKLKVGGPHISIGVRVGHDSNWLASFPRPQPRQNIVLWRRSRVRPAGSELSTRLPPSISCLQLVQLIAHKHS